MSSIALPGILYSASAWHDRESKQYSYGRSAVALDKNQQRARIVHECIDGLKIVSPDIIHIIVGYLKGGKLSFDRSIDLGAFLNSPRRPRSHVRAMSVVDDNRIAVALVNCPCIYVIDIGSGNVISRLVGPGQEITALQSVSRKYLASSAFDGTINVWDFSRGNSLRFSLYHHSESIICLASCGTRFASACSDSTINIWDAHSGVYFFALNVGDIYGYPTSLSYGPGGCLFVGTEKGRIMEFDDQYRLQHSYTSSDCGAAVRNMYVTRHGDTIFCASGCIKIRRKGNKRFNQIVRSPTQCGDTPLCLIPDQDDHFLVGWKRSGITRHNHKGICVDHSRTGVAVSALARLSGGTVLAGTIDGKILLYNLSGIDIQNITHHFSRNGILEQ